ncbi:hypothetical protein [Streptomyces sp. NPDC051776]|uniref:hypothetical protein n=1 Tax=Streptomyces sp. NPDC051776 TaxID=3155414 RepID=UPI00343FC723
MVIFDARPAGPLDDPEEGGGLDERHAARNSQDASLTDPGSEAWIADEEGRIDMRFERVA